MNHSPGFLALVNDAKTRVRETTVDDVQKGLENADDFVLIDTREEHERDEAHIAGAIFLSKGIIEREIERAVPDKSKKIVLYCGGGYRSALSSDNLQKMGYTNVFSLAGGWRAWQKANGVVTTAREE
ncbi:MAG: sulfurtransferase [Bacteroidetes bacterium]|nr:sulfurtransferase [Bacteroidota bacterium]MCW5896853.1 sulfurtransferase [Bacteroidota bacterium]